MSRVLSKARVERLLESGLCESKDPNKHIKELEKLVSQIDEENVKRQSYAFKALADPNRIKILQLLKNRPMCSCEITVALDLTEPNTSHHLNLLERNNIVRTEKTGKWIFYELQQSTIREICKNIIGDSRNKSTR